MPWHPGPTLLEALDALIPERRNTEGPLRMPVQDVYKFNKLGNDERMIVGRLDGGILRVGDEVVFSPSGKRSRVRGLRVFASPNPVAIAAGDNATVVLEDELFVPRGELMHHIQSAPEIGRVLRGRIFWLGRKSLRVGGTYGLRLGTAEIECEVVSVHEATDASTLTTLYDPSEVERNQIAEISLRLDKPVAADVLGGVAELRRFVLLDGYDIWGGGQILSLEPLPAAGRRAIERLPDLRWHAQAVPAAQTAARHGHHPALVLFAGDSGQGKSKAAAALQRALFDAGLHAVLLDCDNVLADAPRDTSLDTARDALAATMERTLQPLLGAGMIVVATTNALGLGDHGGLLGALSDRHLSILLSPDRSARLVDADVVIRGDASAAPAIADLVERVGKLCREPG